MKALILTSNSLRHLYYVKKIAEYFEVVGVITEDKGSYYKEQEENSTFVKNHFERLKNTEKSFFEEALYDFQYDRLNWRTVDKNQINNPSLISWSKSLNVDLVFLFGTGILKEAWLNTYDKRIINLHLGLSPFYKGSATLFWPFFNNELECLGTTIHLASKKVDAGDILKRIKPVIKKVDNYYTVNYKLIKQSVDLTPQIALMYMNNTITPQIQAVIDAKVYRKKDFGEEHLKTVIERYGDEIADDDYELMKTSDRCNC